MMLLRLARTALIAALILPLAAESLEDQIKKTDFASADSVFELAGWCQSNQLSNKARNYYQEVIKLDKDHEGARTALGYVRVGERWVPKAFAGDTAKAAAEKKGDGSTGTASEARRAASGKAPTAGEITWDLKLPPDPQPDSKWINQFIDRMPTIGNDSDPMDAGVRTILRDDNWPLGFPRICKALMDPAFTDLFGPSEIVRSLYTSGRGDQARKIYPFLIVASSRITNRQDLSYFCMITGLLKVKNAVPRMIELMDNADIKADAAEAIASITGLPFKTMTQERAQQWWNINWNVGEDLIQREQLTDPDPGVRIEACTALYAKRDKAIVPVLLALMKNDNIGIARRASALIDRIAGPRPFDPTEPAEIKNKKIELIEKWWKSEGGRWVWVEDRNQPAPTAPTVKVDPNQALVQQLASITGRESAEAEARLLAAGKSSVPALITFGLEAKDARLRRMANDLLRRVTKQDFPFDPQADESARNAAVAKWKTWATDEGLIAP
ncbi:hypothetical protein LBMAG53_15520 [Planctomycetota bacterium]|nr:hypothetical protein LBMAG53_15520 [Planctomycetota bacterium]